MKPIPFLCSMFLILICIPLVTAQYTTLGNPEGDFNLEGSGIFNLDLDFETETNLVGKNLLDPSYIPLVDDLDNDGLIEIIVLDGNTIRLYRNKSLDVLDSQDIKGSSLTNLVIYDYDDDGINELIIINNTGDVNILSYTKGGGFVFENRILTTALGTGGWLGCGEDACVFAYQSRTTTSGGSPSSLSALSFSDAGLLNYFTLNNAYTSNIWCFPLIPSMAIIDYDNDGLDEFIFSIVKLGIGTVPSDDIFTYYLNVNETGYLVGQLFIQEDPYFEANLVGGESCADVTEYTKAFSAPLVFNIDGSVSNGMETIWAFQNDDDEFQMHLYNSGQVELRTYPSLYQADGRIIGNPMRINAFPDTGNSDFCILGSDPSSIYDTQLLDLVCGSYLTGFSPSTYEFFVLTDENASLGYQDYGMTSHATEQTNTPITVDGATSNINEIITPFGVYALDWTQSIPFIGRTFPLFTAKELSLLFEVPRTNATVIMADAEGSGKTDMLFITPTNIFYLDDGFVNSPAQITSVTYNPCITDTFKVNTTFQITLTIDDVNSDLGDQVSARAMVYEGTSAEIDSGWAGYGSAGSTFTFSFTMNETISNAKLLIQINDTGTNTVIDTERFFSVNINGVEFGDTQCSEEFALVDPLDAEAVDVEGDTNLEDNAIKNAFDDELLSSFGLGYTVLWLFIMVGVGVGNMYLFHKMGMVGSSLLIPLAFTELILLIIGVVLGFVSFGVLLAIVAVSLVIFGFWFAKMFSGTSNNNM